jgi:hypothetical protein
MPIDVRELRPSRNAPVELITTDRKCGRCGYSLKGLPSNGRCPECGKPFAGLRSGHKRFSDSLSDAPLYYLRALAWGTGLLAVCGLLSGIAFSLANRDGQLWQIAAAGVASVGWWVGVFIVTAPRPLNDNTLPDAVLESPRLRMVNRALNLSWIASALMLGLKLRVSSPTVDWTAYGLQAIGLLALIPISIHLSSLAFWASDTSLGERFRLVAWVMAVCGLFVLIGEISIGAAAAAMASGGMNTLPSWFLAIAGLVLLFGVWSYLFRMVAYLIFVFSLYQLAHEAVWAVRNNRTASDVAARLLARQEEHMREIAERTATGAALIEHGPAARITPVKSTYGIHTVKPGSGDGYEIAEDEPGPASGQT